MVLLRLIYRDKLFPRQEYRRAFDLLCERLSDRQACKISVELLALAHDRGCEAELARELDHVLGAGALPDLAALRRQFAPDPAELPIVSVQSVSLGSYEALLGAPSIAGAGACRTITASMKPASASC